GCDRQNVFHFQMVKPGGQKLDGRMLRVLDNGTAVHDLVQDRYLAKHPDFWFVKEPKVTITISGAPIRGSCDGVIIRRRDMYRFGIEIKSSNHEEFMRLTKAKQMHVLQASLYMHIPDLPWITVVYWDKDKQHLKEYPVRASKEVWLEA